MKVDFKGFEGTLPYASEAYGVYQPLLGWRSRRMQQRLRGVQEGVHQGVLGQVARGVQPVVEVASGGGDPRALDIQAATVKIGMPAPATARTLPGSTDSLLGAVLREQLAPFRRADLEQWQQFFAPEKLQQLLDEATTRAVGAVRLGFEALARADAGQDSAGLAAAGAAALTDRLNRESTIAGALSLLAGGGRYDVLAGLFFANTTGDVRPGDVAGLIYPPSTDAQALTGADGQLGFGDVALSPVGLVHLFQQYFFEFASFLGPPVQHVWLSPGGTVELVEVSTRKTIAERILENSFEQVDKSEKALTTEDELSDAVKSENQQNTKFGVGLTTSSSGGIGVFMAEANTTTNYELDNSSKESKEQTHKQNRQQTQKNSSEIKRSFKSTFRTVTETTDTTSKRYVLQNTTSKLVNYEMRRKMRQVGVQLQDLGTQLCWQAYVDDPGTELGIARLVHVAEPPDLNQLPNPTQVPMPEPIVKGTAVTINAEWFFEDRKHGFVPIGGRLQLVPPQSGYLFETAEVVVTAGEHWYWRYEKGESGQIDDGDGGKELSITSIDIGVQTGPGGLETDDHPSFTVQVTPVFRPSKKLIKDITTTNTANQAKADEAAQRAAKEAYIKAAQERIKQAGDVQARKFEELREEERVIVYRSLVRQLAAETGMDGDDPQVRHVLSELLQALFDMDRMLYFVAPEWWVPRARRGSIPDNRPAESSPQAVGDIQFGSRDLATWGGANAERPDNYYITADSSPARLGSSLGWTLQLDGDNMRNAFLNAPWVKAVIPIRLGKELDALSWLERNAVEGADGLDFLYQAENDAAAERTLDTLHDHPWPAGSPQRRRYDTIDADELTIRDALTYLALRVAAKHQLSKEKVRDPSDPSLSYLPTDQVYEHGFSHLAGGFEAARSKPFAVFDQWVEVMPTDQIVAVEVTYDPKTGQQV
ncbi:hypothetical protein [Streptomyces sp. NPDC088794]|uniref:hypothetical protein n=1 Tax=Streptomyces sp. NPDC088794 TaxID=3365902 RepID=UPI003806C457